MSIRRDGSARPIFSLACAVVVCLISVASAAAQDAPSQPSAPAPATSANRGLSSADLVRRALTRNTDLAAARLDVDRARGRFRQAGLLPNPSVDFEQRTGRFTGSRGEGETSFGITVPLDVTGRRAARIALAEAEIAAAEAEIADRERRLVLEIRATCAEALAAARELEVTGRLDQIDTETAQFVKVRVGEGESAPLELSLLQVEIDRQRSRRALATGRLDAATLRLKVLVGAAPEEQVLLSEDLTIPVRLQAPPTADEAVEAALRNRPDVQLARIAERAADAGYRLARAQGRFDVAAFGRFSVENSVFDDTPVGALRDRDRTLSFGVAISLPVFDRNQGARAEASAAVAQARQRREFAEARTRAEVLAAYARYRAAESAVAIYERGVIARAEVNVEAIRGAYQVGAYRITELLAEQRRLVDSQREFTEALAERYRSIAELEAAVGIAMPAEYEPAPAPPGELPAPIVGPEDPDPPVRAKREKGQLQ